MSVLRTFAKPVTLRTLLWLLFLRRRTFDAAAQRSLTSAKRKLHAL